MSTTTMEIPAKTGARVKASTPIYGDILDFLIDDAAMLDDDRHAEWLNSLADDVVYTMPVRKTLRRRDGKGFDEQGYHLNDNRQTLAMRVQRTLEVPSAPDRDPAPRIKRLVTNLVVHETGVPDEYAATTYLLLMRNRFEAPSYDMLTAKREDIIRREANGTLKLARRLIQVDQSALGTVYINVFM
ncbi:aromatic-ring-hydroxylating dioxygenase subunit beta [Paraburkholderia sediminicola]|uniref:Aromatic-ring-hydroxylating dioxygenase subunit beta n=1 Tax=Paraburkholderia metrosideri TaxID=580937 RepID=A0ABW9DKA9_9BURK